MEHFSADPSRKECEEVVRYFALILRDLNIIELFTNPKHVGSLDLKKRRYRSDNADRDSSIVLDTSRRSIKAKSAEFTMENFFDLVRNINDYAELKKHYDLYT